MNWIKDNPKPPSVSNSKKVNVIERKAGKNFKHEIKEGCDKRGLKREKEWKILPSFMAAHSPWCKILPPGWKLTAALPPPSIHDSLCLSFTTQLTLSSFLVSPLSLHCIITFISFMKNWLYFPPNCFLLFIWGWFYCHSIFLHENSFDVLGWVERNYIFSH